MPLVKNEKFADQRMIVGPMEVVFNSAGVCYIPDEDLAKSLVKIAGFSLVEEPKEEVKVNIKSEEVKEEIKEEVKEEIKEEVKEPVLSDDIEEINNIVEEEIRDYRKNKKKKGE